MLYIWDVSRQYDGGDGIHLLTMDVISLKLMFSIADRLSPESKLKMASSSFVWYRESQHTHSAFNVVSAVTNSVVAVNRDNENNGNVEVLRENTGFVAQNMSIPTNNYRWASNRRHNKRVIYGDNAAGELEVVSNKKWVHISFFKPNVTAEQILNYVVKHTSIDMNNMECYKLVKKDADLSAIKRISFNKSTAISFFSKKSTGGRRYMRHNGMCGSLSLKIYYQNLGGMRTKINDIFNASLESEYDVIVLVETWLNADFLDEELFDSKLFCVYRKDRDYLKANCVKGGGVLIAVRRALSTSKLVLMNPDTIIDQVCIAITGSNGMLILSVSYVPPNSSDCLYNAHIQNITDLYMKYSHSQFLVIGDFNLSNVIWSLKLDADVLCPHNVNKTFEIDVIDGLYSLSLLQINKFFNCLSKLLDLVFISEDLKCIVGECLNPFCKSDMHHVPLELEVTFYSYFKLSSDSIKLDFNRCNFNIINRLIGDINWSHIFHNRNLSECYDKFKSILNDLIESYVPRMKAKVYKLPWYTSGLKALKNKRNKLYKRYNANKNTANRELYINSLREFNFLNKFLYKQYMLNIENGIKEDPKAFWRYVNSKRIHSDYPSVMFLDSKVSTSTMQAVNLFADFFSSNFVSSDLLYNSQVNYNAAVGFSSLDISRNDIQFGISKLKPSYRVDSDGFCGFFLKNCASSLVEPLLMLFRMSLEEGIFHDSWKLASITPIFKSGAKDNISNYRPISKLCNHGFVRGRSTTTNLTLFSHYCISNFERGYQVDTIYTDLSKAFDKVSIRILIQKLAALGFHSLFLQWIKSYLLDRNYFVNIDDCYSYMYVATSGIPQGSILGPLLFVLFINDVPSCLKWSKILLYADDLKLYMRISSISDIRRLQEDLNSLADWCSSNFLTINVGKCRKISFYKCKNPVFYDYKLNGYSIERVEEVKDLGVIFDYKFTDPYSLKLVYTALVRSHLEYCSCVWSPFYGVYSGRIERIQKRFIKFALRFIPFSDPFPSYIDKCRLIHLMTLENRRTYLSQVFLFKIISGFIDCAQLLELISFNVPARSLRSRALFYTCIHKIYYAKVTISRIQLNSLAHNSGSGRDICLNVTLAGTCWVHFQSFAWYLYIPHLKGDTFTLLVTVVDIFKRMVVRYICLLKWVRAAAMIAGKFTPTEIYLLL
ncbi:uncharacterized protein LOC142231426 [Haematobia irritans]|uniref:uncharacterized protein LOC142231426 n=1 Tax=Haematobia irritans TaxID=7368 RepID=UPI003F50B4CC